MCNCSKNGTCLNANAENFCKGLELSETVKQAKLMIDVMEARINAILSRPPIFNEISQKLREQRESEL